MTVLLNSAYQHRTHLNLVDITVMHCVNSNRESFWSQHTSATTEIGKVWTQPSSYRGNWYFKCRCFARHIFPCYFK